MNQKQIDFANYLELEYGQKIANNYRNLVSSPDYLKGAGYQIKRYPRRQRSRKEGNRNGRKTA